MNVKLKLSLKRKVWDTVNDNNNNSRDSIFTQVNNALGNAVNEMGITISSEDYNEICEDMEIILEG